MKVKVLTKFRDKTNRAVVHGVGDIIDIADGARVRDIVERGIGEVVVERKPEPLPAVTQEEAEAPMPSPKPKRRTKKK